jgi:dTDP-4-dehydrorhamnose reductase
MAERYVRRYDKAWICRVRLPFDNFDNERNLISKYMRYPRVYHSLNSLTHRIDFAKAALEIINKEIPYGTYHCTNEGRITTGEILSMMRANGIIDNFPQRYPEEEFMATVTTKKSNCYLSTEKLKQAGVVMRPVEDAIEDACKNWVPENRLATCPVED